MNRAVIYARYSSKNQNDYSIEAQITSCVQYADKHNMEIVNVYRDKAITAQTDRRPGFQQMIKDSYSAEFDYVIVWALDRFARNVKDAENNFDILLNNNVTVVSVTESFDNSPQGEFIRGLFNLWAQYYSKSLAVTVIRGMDQNVEYCYFNGGQVPFGYKSVPVNDGISNSKRPKKKLVVDEDLRHIVVEIFNRYADGETMKTIYEDLNARGIKTSSSAEFSRTSLNSILKNKRYTGVYIFNGTEVPNGIPSIIPEELFEKVQEKMKANKKAPARSLATEEYLLTGKLFCGECGELLTGTSGKSHTNAVYRYYSCKGAKSKSTDKCITKNIRKDVLEEIVLQKSKMFLTDENIDKIAKEIYSLGQELKESAEFKETEKLIKEKEKERKGLMTALKNCAGNDELAKDILAELEEVKAIQTTLEKKLTKLEKSVETLNYTEIVFFLTEIKNHCGHSFKHKKNLINTFVNKVVLNNDNLMIFLNSQKEPFVISNNEIEEALLFLNSGSGMSAQGAPMNAYPNHFLVNIWIGRTTIHRQD